MPDEVKGLFVEDALPDGGTSQNPQPLNQSEYDAIRNAVAPSATNPFATEADAVDVIALHVTLANPGNSSHHLFGVQGQVAAAQAVNGGSSPTVTLMNRFHLLVNITSIVAAGTLRITGTSYNRDTGTTAPGDTEDIVIGAGLTGYYMPDKLWVGTVTLSSVGGLSVVADLYKHGMYGEDLPDSDLIDVDLSCRSQSASNSVRLEIYHFDGSARTNVAILDITDTNFGGVGTSNHYQRRFAAGIHRFLFSDMDAIYVRLTASNIEDVQVSINLRRI